MLISLSILSVVTNRDFSDDQKPAPDFAILVPSLNIRSLFLKSDPKLFFYKPSSLFSSSRIL